MLTHGKIWTAIDALARRYGLTPSGLARRAGLDATAFNPSKRVTTEGRSRWPTTESLAKVLGATGATIEPRSSQSRVSGRADRLDGAHRMGEPIVIRGCDEGPLGAVFGPVWRRRASHLLRPGVRCIPCGNGRARERHRPSILQPQHRRPLQPTRAHPNPPVRFPRQSLPQRAQRPIRPNPERPRRIS
jgi:hypothetical protein